jgi:hypothetical protein
MRNDYLLLIVQIVWLSTVYCEVKYSRALQFERQDVIR